MRLEYIWPDGSSDPGLRTKTRFADTVEPWSYDGSSTGETTVDTSDITLIPVREYDHFTLTKRVLCQTNTSSRVTCPDDKDWMFGFEQEFFLVDKDTIAALYDPKTPLLPQDKYYCGLGTENVLNIRLVVDQIVENLIDIGINVTGINAEVAPGQWEIQILGSGIKAADDLLMTRYMILTTAESNSLYAIFEPKPFDNWNGSGLHCNFSNGTLRDFGGRTMVYEYIKALENTHEDTFSIYGEGNENRLTGSHEAPDLYTFTSGEKDRTASIRIPSYTIENGYKGYLEDRRPGANADPYKVIAHIVRSIKTMPHILKEQAVKATYV